MTGQIITVGRRHRLRGNTTAGLAASTTLILLGELVVNFDTGEIRVGLDPAGELWADATPIGGSGGGVALGETSTTAYRGDRGKIAYDHSQASGNPHGTTKADVGLGNVTNVEQAPKTPTVGTALATTGAVVLDLAALDGTAQTITLTGNLSLSTSNRSAGRNVHLFITADGSTRTLTWPTGVGTSWTVVGSALPTSLAAGKTLALTLFCRDATIAGIMAAGAVQA